jgi:phage tail sheath protein FI
MLLWNTRASGGGVKQYIKDHTVGGVLIGDRWVNYSGNNADGSMAFLRKAQRKAVVKGLQAAVAANEDIRNETNRFNLVAVPGYPELTDEMLGLSVDRKDTVFALIDAPFRLNASATAVQNWATNGSNAVENGENGLLSSSSQAAVYYPHGLTTNLDGTNVMVPASHMALRTFAYNDQVAFPWFAPAGFQRGLVSNATSVGYLDPAEGEFTPVALNEGQRDAYYLNKVNPVGNFPGRGLAIFGQKTLNANASALDRVNVSRLVIYIREQLDDAVKPFLFEPNDSTTRLNAKGVVDRVLSELVIQRGLYDYVSVCDTSNNTPARIDRNELHIDVAIQPVKAVEFIYIPIRIQNTLGSTG